ncbi:hypothetical protein [Luteipulveratus flavus]|uniref:Uncharacterized protein n=1 Tax=Luteipulveratus flavus TaxID=3031728 RepID=A0ABT6C9U9_9MICO|nr:hypothetical protein [Luteipulveratus sp. YIM 133296]MDF8265680.1 hypothetical protein [Luteipulveratus sp. YIM 133296]
MRRVPATVAAAVLTIAGLTACSTNSSSGCSYRPAAATSTTGSSSLYDSDSTTTDPHGSSYGSDPYGSSGYPSDDSTSSLLDEVDEQDTTVGDCDDDRDTYHHSTYYDSRRSRVKSSGSGSRVRSNSGSHGGGSRGSVGHR